jgi:hypothetical protein
MTRISNVVRAMLTCLLFCSIGISGVLGQDDPIEMLAGKSRTFNRYQLQVVDGPMNATFLVGDPVSSVTGRRAGGEPTGGGGGWASAGGGNRQGGGRVDGEETDGATLEERIAFAKEKALGQFLNTPEGQTQVFWLLVTTVDGEPWAQVYYFKNLTWAQLEARETANAIGDWVQAGLSIAGMVPGVGDVADGINAGVSFFRALADGDSLGDALGVGATTLGAGMLPLGMGAFGNVGKVADALKVVNKAGKGGVRTLPRNLREKLALDKAKGGAGGRIMGGKINDPNYPEDVWAKKAYMHENPGGSQTAIHYWENLQTGAREGFKFK